MIGRGLVANPALAGQAKGGPPASRETLLAFHDALLEAYAQVFGSARNAMLRMKEIWFYHIHLFEGGARHAKQIKKTADPRVFTACAASIFRDLPLRGDAVPGWR